MNNRGTRIAILAPMFFASMPASGAEIQVTLAPRSQAVKGGETPRFIVTVESATGQRVMKFAERSDLRDHYAELIDTRDGKPVEVPRVISDPGPTNDSDYVQLSPGQRVTFEHDGMPYILSRLPPASYSAVVKLRIDWQSEGVVSNPVSFTVER
jgi:hypothetical protein